MKAPIKVTIFTFLIAAFVFLTHYQALANSPDLLEASVVSVSPEGFGDNVRQIQVKFAKTAIKDKYYSAQKNPVNNAFNVECTPKVAGKFRWQYPGNIWVYSFIDSTKRPIALKTGTKCSVSVNPVYEQKVAKVSGKRSFEFVVDGPGIKKLMTPRNGLSEQSVFIVVPDVEVAEESILANSGLIYTGEEAQANRIDFKFVSDDKRQEIIDFKFPHKDKRPAQIILLEPKTALLPDKEVQFIWGKGIKAQESGVVRQSDYTRNFKVRKSFEGLVKCTRMVAEGPCLSLNDINLELSNRISFDFAKQIKLKNIGNDSIIDANLNETSSQSVVDFLKFPGPFPEEAKFQLIIPQDIVDVDGRALTNLSTLSEYEIKISKATPLAKFSSEFGVIEAKGMEGADYVPTLPVSIRNIPKDDLVARGVQDAAGELYALGEDNFEIVVSWMKNIDYWKAGESYSEDPLKDNRARSILVNQTPKAFKLPIKHEFEVLGIPLKEKGFYVVELESAVLGSALIQQPPSGQPQKMVVPTSALVTDLSAHLKYGSNNALIWVTSLSTGQPVAGAKVSIRNCMGKKIDVIGDGQDLVTNKDGVVLIEKNLKKYNDRTACKSEGHGSKYSRAGFFVTASKDDDFTFIHNSWTKGIESYRFLPYAQAQTGDYQRPNSNMIAHTIFDRPLFKTGEEVGMVHILRTHTIDGMDYIRDGRYPQKMTITHDGSFKTFEMPGIKFDRSTETSRNSWSIPADAPLGRYTVKLHFKDKSSVTTGSFRVEEFKVPEMEASIKLPVSAVNPVDNIEAKANLSFLNGTKATGAMIEMSYHYKNLSPPSFDDFLNFRFSNGPSRAADPDALKSNTTEPVVGSYEIGDDGFALVEMSPPRDLTQPKTLVTEMKYFDTNDGVHTVVSSMPVYSANHIAGIRADRWIDTPKSFDFQVAVVTPDGKPVAGKSADIRVLQIKNYYSRVKVHGGFYAYKSEKEVLEVNGKISCGEKSDARGIIYCTAKDNQPGTYHVEVDVKDGEGRSSIAHAAIYVSGMSNNDFDYENHDRIDLIAEKKAYNPGDEEARFQVRMPFQSATLLVTTEREGILDYNVTRNFSSDDPNFTLAINDQMAPNIFVSAFVVKGRSAKGPDEVGKLDLGKPAFKMGLTAIKVGWDKHRINVKIDGKKESYRPREKVTLDIHAELPEGQEYSKNTIAAVAVIDDGLLKMEPNTSWNLLEKMMSPRVLEVKTVTNQMQVVGKRHYGSKALAQGGGGGKQTTREVFDTRVYWNDLVRLEDGKAQIEFNLNDSPTRFKVAVVVFSGNRFGTGMTEINSRLDLEIRSALPLITRDGDKYPKNISLKNTTDKDMNVALVGKAVFTMKDGTTKEVPLDLPEQKTLEANRFENLDVGGIEIPRDAVSVSYTVDAVTDGGARDSFKTTQKILPAVNTQIQWAMLSQVGDGIALPIEKIEGAIPGRGGVQVQLMSKLTQLSSVMEKMNARSYNSLEFKISNAVVQGDIDKWNKLMEELPLYFDKKSNLLKYYTQAKTGSVVLSAYLAAISNASGADGKFKLTDSAKQKLNDGLKRYFDGNTKEVASSHADGSKDYLQRLRLKSMLALAQLGSYVSIDDYKTLSALDPANMKDERVSTLLDRMALLLEAKLDDPDLELIAKTIKGRLQHTSQGMAFDSNSGSWWMMSSDSTSINRLILMALRHSSLKMDGNDITNMVLGSISQQNKGSWGLSTANAWGSMALRKFSASNQVSGTTVVDLSGNESVSVDMGSDSIISQMLNWLPSTDAQLKISHKDKGQGSPWANISAYAAVKLDKPRDNGFTITKTYEPAGNWKQGDVITVTLTITPDSDAGQVKVFDPIPSGAKITSKSNGTWSGYTEAKADSYNAYYDYMHSGGTTITYKMILNAHGDQFEMPATTVQAIYKPEMIGQIPNDSVSIEPMMGK